MWHEEQARATGIAAVAAFSFGGWTWWQSTQRSARPGACEGWIAAWHFVHALEGGEPLGSCGEWQDVHVPWAVTLVAPSVR